METLEHATLSTAFTEWHRRWVEEPDRYLSEVDALGLDSEDYGDQCAGYLLALIAGTV